MHMSTKLILGFIMDLRYKCGNYDYRDVKDATAVFQALSVMTEVQKNIPVDFLKKISIKIIERLS